MVHFPVNGVVQYILSLLVSRSESSIFPGGGGRREAKPRLRPSPLRRYAPQRKILNRSDGGFSDVPHFDHCI